MEYVHDLTEMSDEALLSHSTTHPSAFEILVARYQSHFLERALYIVKTKDDAEDVVQDAFVRIYRFAPRFNESMGSFKSWAMTILMNVARSRYQKKAKEWKRSASLTQEHYEALPAPSEKDALQAKDIITRALEHVPEDIARILRLAFIEELPYSVIAEREGIQVGAVKTRVHRAKKVLKETIGDIKI